MATEMIHFITWNVNGLKEQKEQKLAELHNTDVVFLQETHIGEADDHILKCMEDEWHIFFTKYTPSQKGTAILVKKILDFECISVEKDNCGGYVVLKCQLKGQLYTLASVYNHQTDTQTLDKLSRYLQSMTTGLLVIGGDFNTVLNPFIDKLCIVNKVTQNRSHGKLLSCLKKFMTSLQLVDIWRRINPVKQNYTFKRGDTFSRLDYFFIPEECLWRVTSCDITDLERPDHQPLNLFLKINNISTDTSQRNPQIRLLSQLLRHKGMEMTASSSVEESELSEVDIVSALHSLQVSDTLRPDGIPASFFKENIQVVIPYIKMLYSRILSGTFNSSESRFNESVVCAHDNSRHFFNVDYIIIATILARRLEDFLESQSKRRIPKDSNAVLITPKALHTQTMLSYIREELDRQRQSNPNLFQDFCAATSLLGDVEDTSVPCQGCPLTPVLTTLALKGYTSQLFQDLEKHVFFIFKQSVIVCFLPKDQDNVNAIVTNSTNEEFDIAILFNVNDKPLLLINVDSESEVEDWDSSKRHGSEEESENDFTSQLATYKMSAMNTKEQKKLKADGTFTSKNTTSPKKSSTQLMSQSTQTCGFKRKRNESPDSSQSLTTDSIMKKTKDIIKNIHSKIPDQDSTNLKTYIAEQISNMDIMNKSNKNRKKIAIGIFGRSGEGKSSLLSAILGERYLLPSGSSGACTAITTQVEANPSNSNYTAEIEFISKEEWDVQFKEILQELSEEIEEKNDDINKNAIEKLTALYGANALKKKWDDLRKDARTAEIDKLLLMRKNIISEANSADFAKKIANFIQHTYSKSNPGGWFWPLVKSVTIKIPNCHELLEHIVLIDLPGTGDCNKIRDNLWKSKLRECSSVWIVSGIHRAISDENPWEILKQCIYHMTQAGECKSINFICTKSDDIDPKEYIRNEWPREEVVPDKDLITACIRKRNISAKETVRESFENSKLKKKMSLNIFTVSSRAFFDKTLRLEHSDTEIPLLQDVLRNLNQSINRELARDYISEAKGIVSLIRVKSDPDENLVHKEFENNLEKALEKLDCQFEMLRGVLEQCLTDGVEESERSCLKSARSIISPDLPHGNRGFHKILKAMCNNKGYHWSKAWNIDLDLNMELAQHMHKNIEEEFDSIFPVYGKTGKSVQEQIDKFSIIQSDTKDHRSYKSCHIENFIKTEENKLKIKLKREVVKRKKDIYLSIQMTIKNAMALYYERAAQFTGTGSMRQMQSTLTEGIENLKYEMFNDAKAEVMKKFRELEMDIKEALDSGIQSSVRLLLSGKITMPYFSEHITELEYLLKQLSD